MRHLQIHPPTAPETAGRDRPRAVGRVDVSVLVPVLNEGRGIEAAATAMLAQDVDGEVEFLFVDGGSTDDGLRILERLRDRDPRVRLLANPGRTVPRGLNVGLRAARGRFVARMDAHTVYAPDYLRRGIDRLTVGDVDWVSGPPVPVGRGRCSALVSLALGSGLGRGASDKWAAESKGGRPEEHDLTTSVFAGVWRRETLDELGGWDPAWDVNEDSEMAARLLRRGGRLVSRAEMAAGYTPRDSLRGLARQYAGYGRFRAKTFARHPTSAGPLRVATTLLPVVLASAVLPGPVGRTGRRATSAYGLVVVAQAARVASAPSQVVGLSVVLATMHVAFAGGFLRGLVAHGPRHRALRASAPRPLARPAAARAAPRDHAAAA